MNEIVLNNEGVRQLNKSDAEALGKTLAVQAREVGAPLDLLVTARKFKLIIDAFYLAIEQPAREAYEKYGAEEIVKADGAQITIRSGSDIPDYEADSVYADLKAQLGNRKSELDRRLKSTQEFEYDSQGAEIDKVRIKGVRKDSIIIKL